MSSFRRCTLVATAIALCAAAPATATAAESTVKVNPKHPVTATKVILSTGQNVTITAFGNTKYVKPWPKRAAKPGPDGFPVTGECAAQQEKGGWEAPGLNCYALLYRVGGGPWAQAGSEVKFTAAANGDLELGYNDSHYEDNSGKYTAKISF